MFKAPKYFGVFLILTSLSFFSIQANAVTEKGFKSLHIFTKVLNYLEENYVDEIDDQKVIQGAISGMLRTLDPHTVYMSPEVFKELKVDTKGRFDGIGIEVAVRDNALTVIAPIRGTPADKAGIEPGDVIVKIDGKFTENMDLTEAVTRLRGSRGSRVSLTILREGNKKPFEFKILREPINVPSVKYQVLDGNYGYVGISSFQEGTAKDLRKALKKLKDDDALNGLVLDLRKNPGGLLDQTVDVSNLFLRKGVIVTTESRNQKKYQEEATVEGDKVDCPMVVLVDGGSASASEIVAGALQDNKRAMILGTKTFGKGSVQTVIELDDGSALKLTVARYYTPSGRSIQAQGIEPDIIVPSKPPKIEDDKKQLREESLAGHLEVPSEDKAEPVVKSKSDILEDDYQIRVALDYLKSWEVFKGDASHKDAPRKKNAGKNK